LSDFVADGCWTFASAGDLCEKRPRHLRWTIAP
jgi:hypothetical protein